MRVLAVAIAVTYLVGCDEPSEPSEQQPEWSVALEQFAVDGWVPTNSAAVRASDGTFSVAVHTQQGARVRIGEQMLEGSQVVRVSADGEILGIASAKEADLVGGGLTRLRTDDLGNIVVIWNEALAMASYDANLNRSWSQPFDNPHALFDVSPQGAIALTSTDGVAGTDTITVMHPDGTVAWTATQVQILAIRFAPNGDLFAIGAGHRWRYDSIGNIVDDIKVTSGTTFADPDGGWLYAKPMKEASELDRYDSTGSLVWSRTYPYELYIYDMIVSAMGNILVRGDVYTLSPVLLELDASTGDERLVVSGCVNSVLVAADAEDCYGISHLGLSKFALH